jgi:hypothetical protein
MPGFLCIPFSFSSYESVLVPYYTRKNRLLQSVLYSVKMELAV